MFNNNRINEKQPKELISLLDKNNIIVDKILDFSFYEKNGLATEGTGSIIFDRINKIAFISLSQRTNKNVAKKIVKNIGYKPIFFTSYDIDNYKIYHTNVMMSIGEKFAILCKECILNKREQDIVMNKLTELKKDIIVITKKQVNDMCGNILELRNSKNEIIIITSDTANKSFTKDQKEKLNKYGKIISTNITNIESIGGGGVRCMISEIF